MTKHRYEFTCGHTANATNEEAMRVTRHGIYTHRMCPKCYDRVQGQIDRCYASGHKPRGRTLEPLPEPGGLTVCRACGELVDTDDDGLCEECAKIKREEQDDVLNP